MTTNDQRNLARGEPIVAIGLLTQRDLKSLGSALKRVYAVEETDCFDALLKQLDEIDRRKQSRAGDN